ncbi:MAG: histidinol-phosphate transaminase [Bradyrhizobium sp.]|jgi:histidinol-phosphate aminotransferase|uniref:Histidinol-phosphate aminotransferase family protein n=2 Tax=Bradyrhizobium TaxID=374 RepID=A0ABS5G1D9_9BRAD|nr:MULTISPECIES: histidinol-phosphate transaminase [Bradyrhizobium]MBR1135140.1 histidinol-phosphate aminotransferase family protein [Bradyrhizobium denitrificans]MDU1494026.1 histidinol-phosphate transaminase [Bradyrhizobium sp.]MDU1544184.1 histidinol-phosphate transaminase [Bradyrhizobium sp.]MDU1807151.1 histidinol-phosphate transaminase [Bradyrhizobium sp.]MDU2924935.1 histidinol-phosphate transaminase [Bradyrhizobium sp.]
MADALPPPSIRLALNETPLGPSPAAIDAIKADLSGLARYTGRELDDLTAAIAARENIAPEQIVLGENLNVLGLYLSARGGRGGTFVYSEPGYTALVDAVTPAGGRVVGVPLNAALENDLPAIAAVVDGTTRAVYLVNPHNPSGTVSDTAAFIAAVRDLSARTLVIVDEAYLEFMPDFAARSVAPLVREGGNVAVFRTFSKIFGLASLAIGYTLAPKPLAAALKQMGIGAFFGLSRLSLVAATASLGDHDYVASVRTKVAAEREAWHALLRARGRRFSASQANFVFFDCGRPHAEAAAALAARGIIIGRAQPQFDAWLRISIGLPVENAIARQAVAELLPASG